MKKQRFAFGIPVLAGLILAGCGGDETPATHTQEITGQVYSETVKQYTVFYDVNENGLPDAGEPSVLSDANGRYTLSITPTKMLATIAAKPATAADASTLDRGTYVIDDHWEGLKTVIVFSADYLADGGRTAHPSVEAPISFLSDLCVEMMHRLDANTTFESQEALYAAAEAQTAALLGVSQAVLFADPESDKSAHALNVKAEALELLMLEGFKKAQNSAGAASKNAVSRDSNTTVTVSRNTIRKAILTALQNSGSSAWNDIGPLIEDVDSAFEPDISMTVRIFIASQVTLIADLMNSSDSVALKNLHMADLLSKAVVRVEDSNASLSGALIPVVQQQRVFMAISGGGWNSHSATAGWLMGAMQALKNEDKNGTMQELTNQVEAMSCNSGGCWFTSHLAFSESFLEEIQDADVGAYISDGYLGQIKNIFTGMQNYNISWPDNGVNFEDLLSGTATVETTDSLLKDAVYLGNVLNFTSWFDTMQKTAFAPLDVYGMAETATLADDDRALAWASDKSIVFSAALNTNANIGGTERELPAEDISDEFLSDLETCTLHLGTCDTLQEISFRVSYAATFSGIDGVPAQVNSSPVFLTKLAATRNHIKPEVFPAGDVNLTYSDTNNRSGTAVSLVDRNISTDYLTIFDAACSSSSAGGGVATVSSLSGYTYTLQDAAAAYYIDTLNQRFTPYASYVKQEETPQYTTSVSDNTGHINQIRMNDGGYIDNTSVAYLVKFLQTNHLDDNFKIVLFMNSSSTDMIVKGDKNATCDRLDANATLTVDGPSTNFCVVSDVARLFAKSNDEYPVNTDDTTYLIPPNMVDDLSAFKLDFIKVVYYLSRSLINDGAIFDSNKITSELNTFVNGLSTTMSANVFDHKSWQSGRLEWSVPLNEDYMASYAVFDVTTVENKSFGIKAGSKGELHIFFSNKTDSSAAPGLTKVTTDVLNAYEALLVNNYTNVQNSTLWPKFKQAFNLAD